MLAARLTTVRGEHRQEEERMSKFRFTKSSYSEPSGECVEVACNVPRIVAIRDSKDPGGPVLTVSPGAWGDFQASLLRYR
ncbi:DUF397 domain-containing protein [Streptomyces anulatus]|uniref:DUF397 domain-containing protein n=1 Tax=Streptomyces anulatus TaxID=1892 RepID=UPI0033C6AD14